jgi:hypothetical protein
VRNTPITVRLPRAPAPVERDFLRMGDGSGTGRSLRVNSRYLELDGRPWLPVMGEFHNSRNPPAEWETELRKMKAGGIDIVASYVFWNHHEETQGRFVWSGERDLRRFVTLVQRVGLHFYLRPGPWVHGEARNGGFPDWLLGDRSGNGALRSNDAAYLQCVAQLFSEIGAQLRGLMFRDGGPVLGVQLENEYDRSGPGCGAEHIAELKRLARAAGLEVPLYTVTGWPTLDIPPRDVVPVSGAYADGFWQGDTGAMPPSGVFLFGTGRTIGEMGNVGGTPASGQIDKAHYPFFLAEAGGGMHVSYHRRPVLSADDVAATALVQIGSGATLYGYYMYHGGTNPKGVGRLNETQASGYPNDVPVLGYDFRAPLGQYGQMRASYGRLRTLHLFLAAFGEELATMEAVLAEGAPTDPADTGMLRVAARGAGTAGFVFVNNHVRHHPMPAFDGVQLAVHAGDQTLRVPDQPVRVPSGAYFIWPMGQRIGAALLRHATVQPLTRWVEGNSCTWVAFSHPALPAELCFDATSVRHIDAPAAWRVTTSQGLLLRLPESMSPQRLALTDSQGVAHTLLVLSQALADQCFRVELHGRQRLALCAHGLHVEDDALVVTAPHDLPARVRLFPADDLADARPAGDGFAEYEIPRPALAMSQVAFTVVHDHQEPPALRMGAPVAWRARPVPLAPDDAEFDAGATRLRLHLGGLPADRGRVLLAIDYIGDVARLYADGELVDDNFGDGEAWYVGVDRFAVDGRWPRLELRIVPARSEPPVFLESEARQRLASAGARARLRGVQATLWQAGRLVLRRAA